MLPEPSILLFRVSGGVAVILVWTACQAPPSRVGVEWEASAVDRRMVEEEVEG